jgi:hypothetical protein
MKHCLAVLMLLGLSVSGFAPVTMRRVPMYCRVRLPHRPESGYPEHANIHTIHDRDVPDKCVPEHIYWH